MKWFLATIYRTDSKQFYQNAHTYTGSVRHWLTLQHTYWHATTNIQNITSHNTHSLQVQLVKSTEDINHTGSETTEKNRLEIWLS